MGKGVNGVRYGGLTELDEVGEPVPVLLVYQYLLDLTLLFGPLLRRFALCILRSSTQTNTASADDAHQPRHAYRQGVVQVLGLVVRLVIRVLV